MVQYFTSAIKLYSSSLFNYALEKNILESISKDVSNLSSLFVQNPDLLKIVSAPIYSDSQQHQILISAVNSLNCSQEIINFILLLAKNKRLSLLDKILQHFDCICKDYSGKKIIEVISSYAMPEEETLELKTKLDKIFSAQVELSLKEDPEILGGLIIKLKNQMFDASLKTKFEKLTSAVTEEIALL